MKSSLVTNPPLSSPAANGYGELYAASLPSDTQMEGISIGNISMGARMMKLIKCPIQFFPSHQLGKDYNDRIHAPP